MSWFDPMEKIVHAAFTSIPAHPDADDELSEMAEQFAKQVKEVADRSELPYGKHHYESVPKELQVRMSLGHNFLIPVRGIKNINGVFWNRFYGDQIPDRDLIKRMNNQTRTTHFVSEEM